MENDRYRKKSVVNETTEQERLLLEIDEKIIKTNNGAVKTFNPQDQILRRLQERGLIDIGEMRHPQYGTGPTRSDYFILMTRKGVRVVNDLKGRMLIDKYTD